jgi:hypothetical protein
MRSRRPALLVRMEREGWILPRQAAALLGVSVGAVYKMLAGKKLRERRALRFRLVREADVRALIDKIICA